MTMAWKGKEVAAAVERRARALSARLLEAGVTPTLAMVRVGEREEDLSYERGARRRCEGLGVAVRRVVLDADATEDEALSAIQSLNEDGDVHGILLFRPLPGHLDEGRICEAIEAGKDVDGVTGRSLCGLLTGSGEGFAPCTARACMEFLDYYGESIEGKRAVVVGRSLVVGKPASLLLLGRDATVTVCHSRTRGLPAICREGDILVVSTGRRGALSADCFREGQVVLDVGIHAGEDGSLCGDVRWEDLDGVVRAATPVPGGVGAVTSAVLAGNVIEAACKAAGVPMDIAGAGGRANPDAPAGG